jgi:hypothetical protein
LSEEERFVESVQLLLDRFRSPLNLSDGAADLGLALLSGAQHVLFDEPHVPRRRL